MSLYIVRNMHKFYTNIYGCLYNRNLLPKWMLSPLRRSIRYFASRHLPRFLKKAPLPEAVCRCNDVIVSLTTFPARINDVWMTVSCLLRQTYIPAKIILWLSKEQFPSKQGLPNNLTSLENDVFEIRFVDGDIRSHKKYVYAFREFPDMLVITVDDDLIYSPSLIESLIEEHKKHPDDVLCRYAKKIKRDAEGNLLPYNRWQTLEEICDTDVFFGSGGGTLFQPHKMYKDVFDLELSQALTPLADDIWLNAMCRLAGLKIRLITRELYLFFDKNEKFSLSKQNVEMQQNDVQLKSIMDYYIETTGINPFKEIKSYENKGY